MFSYARFVDRDTLMRHYGGGIGHFDNTPFSEDDDENMDIDDDEVEDASLEVDTLDSRHTSGLDNGGSSNLESDSEEGSTCSSSESESDLDFDSDSDLDVDSEFEELVSF